MGKDEKIRGCAGVIAHQLQGIRETGLLFKSNLKLRNSSRKIIFQRRDNSVFLVVPDHKLAGFSGIQSFFTAGCQAQ